MTTSNDNVGDRPARRHFNGIVFGAMALMALIVLLAILFFHFNKSAVAPLSKSPGTPQSNPSTQK
jgi:hypothetical protein